MAGADILQVPVPLVLHSHFTLLRACSITAKQHMQWIEVATEARGGQGFQELLLNPVTQSLSER